MENHARDGARKSDMELVAKRSYYSVFKWLYQGRVEAEDSEDMSFKSGTWVRWTMNNVEWQQ